MTDKKKQRDNKGRFVKGHTPVNNTMRNRRGQFATREELDEEFERNRDSILRMWKELAGYSKRKPRKWSPRQVDDEHYEVIIADDYQEYE